ncbi:heterokaryon incompatibility protein-domain-containing protein [Cadophora sp. MPI-SDFR-AT-0126]|nr:heterokaryon incompatibility protein-domain-containing protein [Leotiomycetes sp. MPI-SDFR-AT-0126]
MKLYEYSSLTTPEEFRILILAPGSGSEPLRCLLKHAILSDEPKYDAISYAWGDPSKPREIISEDCSIPITESLFSALQHLRHEHEEIAIWADAVCIHQRSDIEKNHQLVLMGMIYSSATRTLVWLGEDKTECAADAFRRISYLYNSVLRRNEMTNEEIRQQVLWAYQHEGCETFEEWYMNFIDMIAPIFSSPYFYRLWVVQEFALGRNIQLVFGAAAMSMYEFISVLLNFINLEQGSLFQERYNFHGLCNLLDMDSIRDDYQRQQRSPDGNPTNGPSPLRFPQILELIRQTERQFFTDPRDRLYAILSLTTTPGFSADYTSTVDETFMSFASWALTSFSSLALLSVARGVSETRFKLPSWTVAPDMAGLDSVELSGPWDTPPRLSNMPPTGLPVTFLHVVHFKASGIGALEMTPENSACWSIGAENILQLKGCIIDSLQTRGDRWLNTATSRGRRQSLIEAVTIAKCKTLHFGDDRYRRFCAAMTFELSIGDTPAPPTQHVSFDRYVRRVIHGSGGSGQQEEILAGDANFTAIYSRWARYRFFCLTTLDRFAWVPHLAESGDKICIAQGSRIPYVLRPQPDGRFMLVGECWIQGFMDGEALLLPDFRWDDIHLE